MRNPLIDNAKGVLIFLVVFGHYLEAIDGWNIPYLGAILSTIYLFHMPAFVFLAGITAKRDRLAARIGNIAIILVVFQMAYVVPLFIADGEWPVGLLQPYWILWFLLSLICWMLLIPLVDKVPYVFAISILIATVGGLFPWDGYQLSAMRTLTFLPFFVGGKLYGHRMIAALQVYGKRRFLAVPIFGVAALLIYSSGLEKSWLYGSLSYAQLGVDGLTGIVIRAAIFILSAASMVAFLACMTSKSGHLSVIGQNSLAVFVLHGFAVNIAHKVIGMNGQLTVLWGLAFAVLAAVMTTLVFAHPVFTTKIRTFAASISRCFERGTGAVGS